MPGPVHVVVVVHPPGELLADMPALGQKHLVVVDAAEMRAAFLGQHHVVETDAVARRIDVQLPD